MDLMKTIVTVLFMFHALLKEQMALNLEDSSNYINQKKIEINRKQERARILMDEFVREAEATCQGKKGSSPSLPGLSCKDIKDSGEFNRGIYWIRPEGSSDSFQGYCDMSAVGQWKKVTAQAYTFRGGVTITYSDENNGLAISGQVTSYGCGDGKESGALTLIEGYWRKIKYTQAFRGVASCWSIFGDNWYGRDSVSNHPTGVHHFNASEGDFITNQYYMGGDSHSFDGDPRRCDNDRTNFWDNPDRRVRYATVVLRRNLTEQKAGIFTGTSCGKPWYKIRDIFVYF